MKTKTATIEITPIFGTSNYIYITLRYKGKAKYCTEGHRSDKQWLIDNAKQWGTNQGFTEFKIQEVVAE